MNQSMNPHARRIAAYLLAGAATGFPALLFAQDIYIGTLTVQMRLTVLRRCDLVQNTYVLEDTKDSGEVVERFTKDNENRTGMWYAEVIGKYEEVNGRNVLRVLSIENLTEGKSCHLDDAMDALPKK